MLILQLLTWVLVVCWLMSLCLPDLTSDHQLINIENERIQVIYCFYMILVLVAGVLCTWHGMRTLQRSWYNLSKDDCKDLFKILK